MSETVAVADSHTVKAPSMGKFERYLTLWVALCIVAGVALGQMLPAPFRALGAATVAQVNLPVAGLVWLMLIPMLLKIDLAALGEVRAHWRGIVVTVGVNWLVKPFSMALLGWLLFRPFRPLVRLTPISPASFCWRRPHARRWYLSGQISWRANRISRCRKSLLMTRSW